MVIRDWEPLIIKSSKAKAAMHMLCAWLFWFLSGTNLEDWNVRGVIDKNNFEMEKRQKICRCNLS